MKKSIENIKEIVLREFKRITEQKTIYVLSIITSLIIFFLYALIYKNELVRELPVGICDLDYSMLSRKITESVESTSSMKIMHYFTSVEEIKQSMRQGKIVAAFYIPKGLENKIKKGENSTVVIYINASNLIVSNIIYKDGLTILRTISGGILLKKLEAKKLSKESAINLINPIRLDTNSLYNPNYSYLSYLVPGLIAFSLQIIIIITAAVSIGSEFTDNSFEKLLKIPDNNLSAILIGKSLPLILIHTVNVFLILGIIFPLLNIPIHGNVLLVALFIIYYIISCVMLGLLISSIFHNQLLATEFAVFINTPAFILSGFTFPIWAMPLIPRVLAQLMPFTHFLNGFLKLYLMDTPIATVIPEIGILTLFTIGSFLLSILILKYKIKKL
ncbi:ABC transporter permease [Melioribacteraceae bacterium 4301-Me]|uniref:ABC transporter permease n=1 Tax=Pyranulibacter aquaticus TaxID=3163344 RepID=UPI003598B6FC